MRAWPRFMLNGAIGVRVMTATPFGIAEKGCVAVVRGQERAVLECRI